MSVLPSPMILCKSKSEHGEQAALIQWCKWHKTQVPALDLLFAIPNGGARDKITASNLKAEGVRPGVSDLFLPEPAHGKAGLWLEMKRFKGGEESEEQIAWGLAMKANGFGYVCCHGWQAAAKILMQYLGFSERPWGDGSLQSDIKR